MFFVSRAKAAKNTEGEGAMFTFWRLLIRYVAPLAVLAVFLSNLR